jgi:hypothetical protein
MTFRVSYYLDVRFIFNYYHNIIIVQTEYNSFGKSSYLPLVHYYCSRKYVNVKALTTKDKQTSQVFFCIFCFQFGALLCTFFNVLFVFLFTMSFFNQSVNTIEFFLFLILEPSF